MFRMSVMQFWADMEQEEYDPEEFVERLAFRSRYNFCRYEV